MITEKDLLEAIVECQGERNPSASTCIKLAAFYTILDHVRDRADKMPAADRGSSYRGESEFGAMASGMSMAELLPILEELMEALQVVNPRLYAGVIRKIREAG